MTLTEIQKQLPWGKPYSEKFNALDLPYKDFQHAIQHTMKALGKLSAIIEDADHGQGLFFPKEEVEKYLADVVICAIRAASVTPVIPINIEEAVIRRIEAKNGITLKK
jgi:hypothetical protein